MSKKNTANRTAAAVDDELAASGYGPILSSADVQQILDVSGMTLWRLRKTGALPALQAKPRSRIRYRRSDVARYLAESSAEKNDEKLDD